MESSTVTAPGTVPIQDLQRDLGGEIILQPMPTNDPNDPLNWTKWEKYLNLGLAQFYALMVFALIAVATPTWAPMNEQLGFSYVLLNDSYAAGSAALCIGALLIIPFALKYGRRPIYICSLLVQIGVAVWAAKLQTVADLMLVNVFNCGVGALCEVIVQMTVADVFFVHERGSMNNIYLWVANTASSLGPVASGYVVDGMGWRWVWWWVAILLGGTLIAFVFGYEDSKYVPTVSAVPLRQPGASAALEEKETKEATEPREDSGDLNLHQVSSFHAAAASPPRRKPYWQRMAMTSSSPGNWSDFLCHIYQPLFITATFPAVLFTAVLYGITTAGYQITITVIATYMPYEPWNFNAAQVGLMSIPGFIGISLSTLLSGPLVDGLGLRLARRNNGIFEPEMRLGVLAAFGPFIPAGLLMFGYGLDRGYHWAVPAVGSGLFTFGMGPVGSVALTYITDSYTNVVADAVVGVVFVRNAFATAFIFAITPWVAKVGLGNFFLTFAMISVACILPVVIFMIWGKRLRIWTAQRYYYYSARQMDVRGRWNDGVVEQF